MSLAGQAVRRTGKQTADRQSDRQSDRNADRNADRQTERQTERQAWLTCDFLEGLDRMDCCMLALCQCASVSFFSTRSEIRRGPCGPQSCKGFHIFLPRHECFLQCLCTSQNPAARYSTGSRKLLFPVARKEQMHLNMSILACSKSTSTSTQQITLLL